MSDTNTTAVESIPTDFVMKYKGHEAFIGDVSAKGLLYLLQYGWAQSLQDSVAGYAKSLKDEGVTEGEGDNKRRVRDYTDEEIAKAVNDRMAERAADILSGEVGTRAGTPRLSGVDKIMRDVAREAIKAQVVSLNAKGKKVAMPTGEKLAKFVEDYITKNGEAVKAEAERRMASQQVDVDEDFEAALTAE